MFRYILYCLLNRVNACLIKLSVNIEFEFSYSILIGLHLNFFVKNSCYLFHKCLRLYSCKKKDFLGSLICSNNILNVSNN